jgi:cytochrome c
MTFKLFAFSILIGGAALAAGSVKVALAQDAAAGEKTFNVCRACHEIGDGAKNLVGPVLNGVVGRKAGSYPGYPYSDANKNSGITWDEATLTEYLKNPRAKVPGTKMLFPGLKKDDDILNVIAFLKQHGADISNSKLGRNSADATSSP